MRKLCEKPDVCEGLLGRQRDKQCPQVLHTGEEAGPSYSWQCCREAISKCRWNAVLSARIESNTVSSFLWGVRGCVDCSEGRYGSSQYVAGPPISSLDTSIRHLAPTLRLPAPHISATIAGGRLGWRPIWTRPWSVDVQFREIVTLLMHWHAPVAWFSLHYVPNVTRCYVFFVISL